jgi:hypothetical protein
MQMTPTTRFELSNPPIVAEPVEGEVIAINLETGSYYSLVGPAAQIWGMLLDKRSEGEILAGVAGAAADDALAESLRQFVESLLAEGLIRPTGDATSREPVRGISPWTAETLRFDRFMDMQELLVLDPIHEIDDKAGWPQPAG